MTENQNMAAVPQAEEEELDIMEMARRLLKEWKFIIVCAAVAGALGVVFAVSRVRSYTVDAVLVPEVIKGNSRSGSISTLAAMAGLNLNAMGSGGDAVSPLVYPEIINSAQFISELFGTPVTFRRKDEIIDSDLYTYYKEHQKCPWWSYVTQAPFMALNGLMSLLSDKKEEVEGYDSLDPSALTREQARIAKFIRKSMSMSVDNKTGLISVSVVAQDASVAYTVCERVIQNLGAHIQTYRTEKARNDLKYYQQLYDEAQQAYYEAQQTYARYLDSNQGLVLHRVLVERERLQNEAQLAFQVYNASAQQLQVAKATLQEEKPVCVVINPPTRPVKPSDMSGMKLLVAVVFLGICAAGAWILFGKDAWEKLCSR